jgi:hypothetical protein
MARERFVPAERLIQEALDVYIARGDELGAAEAHYAFGNFYKHRVYHGKFAGTFTRLGTYDATYTRALRHFEAARLLYEKHGDDAGVTKSVLGIGNAYSLRGERPAACASYDAALRAWANAKRRNPDVRLPILTQFRDATELIWAFKRADGCP